MTDLMVVLLGTAIMVILYAPMMLVDILACREKNEFNKRKKE